MYKEWYVFDEYSDGYTEIYSEYESTNIVDRLLSTPHCIFIGKYATYEEEIQNEVDKASGNYDEDYVSLTQEDYDLDEEED